MLFTAPGKTSQMPTVATVSIAPLVRAAVLGRQNQFGSGAERIVPIGHQDPTGVSARALHQNPQTRRRGNVRDNPQGNLLALQ